MMSKDDHRCDVFGFSVFGPATNNGILREDFDSAHESDVIEMRLSRIHRCLSSFCLTIYLTMIVMLCNSQYMSSIVVS